jgi:hypothetical protein
MSINFSKRTLSHTTLTIRNGVRSANTGRALATHIAAVAESASTSWTTTACGLKPASVTAISAPSTSSAST